MGIAPVDGFNRGLCSIMRGAAVNGSFSETYPESCKMTAHYCVMSGIAPPASPGRRLREFVGAIERVSELPSHSVPRVGKGW